MAAGEASTTAATTSTEATLTTLASLSSLTLTALTSLTLAAVLTVVLAIVLSVVLTIVLTVVLTIVLTIVLAAVVVVAAAVATNGEPYTVILGTTLSNRHDNRCMVAGRGKSAGAVDAIRKTISKVGSKLTLAVGSGVDTLEESKRLWVRWLLAVDVAIQVLDSDVRVANNISALESLGGSVVGVVGIRKRASHQVVGLDGECDCLVGLNSVAILGVDKDS